MKKFFVSAIFMAGIISATCFAQDEKNTQTELKKETSVGKNIKIRINSNNRNIEVQSWKEDKVKVTIKGLALYKNVQDDDILEKLGVTMHQLGNSINIDIRESGYNEYTLLPGSPDAKSSSGDASIKTIVVFVPYAAKLSVNSKYGNISLKNTFNNLDLDITNGNADVENVGKLNLVSKYANVSMGDIKTAEIDFMNGHFSANNVDEIDMDTKYSNIELASVNKFTFISTNDEYEIDNAGKVEGRKNYGNIRITKLTGSIEMDGTNADVKIRNIASSVTLLKFDNKYADLRLPLTNLKNFTITVDGDYNTVYEGFKDNGNRAGKINGTFGDGKDARIQVKCQNCTIDFK